MKAPAVPLCEPQPRRPRFRLLWVSGTVKQAAKLLWELGLSPESDSSVWKPGGAPPSPQTPTSHYTSEN